MNTTQEQDLMAEFMQTGNWRERSRAALLPVLARLPHDVDMETLDAAVRAAYPFGERRRHPHHIWKQEVREAIAKRFPHLSRAKGAA